MSERTMSDRDYESLAAWADDQLVDGRHNRDVDRMLELWRALDDDDRARVKRHGWEHLLALTK